MNHPFQRLPLILIAGTLLTLSAATVWADQTVKTGIPGGDGKSLLESGKDKESDLDHGAILVIDEECAHKARKGPRLDDGRPNPLYLRCVKDKLEKAKKTGDH